MAASSWIGTITGPRSPAIGGTGTAAPARSEDHFPARGLDSRRAHGRLRPRAAIASPPPGGPMELLLRGKYVLTSATDSRVLTDAAVRVSGDTVAEVGAWR